MTMTISPAIQACSFEQETWDDGAEFGIDGFVLTCDVHGAPAMGDVYDTGVGLCQPQAGYAESHQPRREDPSRCRCGRPLASCSGAADAQAILATVQR